jgi:hypothetical protein
MTMNDAVIVVILVAVVVFLLYVPIFKPWFGFRRPPDHRGRWGE